MLCIENCRRAGKRKQGKASQYKSSSSARGPYDNDTEKNDAKHSRTGYKDITNNAHPRTHSKTSLLRWEISSAAKTANMVTHTKLKFITLR